MLVFTDLRCEKRQYACACANVNDNCVSEVARVVDDGVTVSSSANVILQPTEVKYIYIFKAGEENSTLVNKRQPICILFCLHILLMY